MKITQYCVRCGTKMELDFGRRFKRSRCPGCKLRFSYREGTNGELTYDYKVDDVQDLYVAGENGAKDERLIDIARRNTEVMNLGKV